MAEDSVRVDSWLWAVRLFKTRSQAQAACRGGHVRVDGDRAKPATLVGPGSKVVVTGGEIERTVVVQRALRKRVGAPLAAQAMIDETPPPPPKVERAAVPQRERGAGRPTKRERRDITRLRGY
ncbi:RNA-binding S4 domain-containing protein [Georgenia sp. 311]|uniref:RNA-binding S4 domain-containing protein n=1 Tax=Georgenia wutianyii TaxID=2585135 RepID=A0ABX5VKK2_9MICO|nr:MULTISPECIES: RNA-binding S4 domain-containing protein [Georgenia]QDB78976.1 RNA-binding S4 domain-containing protein [Georgenia wutianyii]TNC17227.1 RNA-binding S4 domain-containing protein [Georgenia sp. 311]